MEPSSSSVLEADADRGGNSAGPAGAMGNMGVGSETGAGDSEGVATVLPPSPTSDSPSPAPAPIVITTGPLFTSARVALTARVVFIILALMLVAYFTRPVIVPVLLAWMVSMTLKTPVRWLRHCRVPAVVAAALVVALFVAVVGAGAIYLGRPAAEWLATAPDKLPRIKGKFQHILRPAEQLSAAATSVSALATDPDKQPSAQVEVKDNRMANTLFSWTGSLLAGGVEVVALLFLLLASGEMFLQKLVRAMPRLRDKKQAVEISREIQQSISTYLFSATLINATFGVAVGVALHLVGMPNAIMWGGVAMFANFIPYLGTILAMAAVTVAGLLAFDTLGHGLLPVAIYAGLHGIESYAITPYVLGRRFALNPVMIFVALIFCAWLWGVIGALLAVPLVVTIKVVADRVPALHYLGDLLGAEMPVDPPPPAQTPQPSL